MMKAMAAAKAQAHNQLVSANCSVQQLLQSHHHFLLLLLALLACLAAILFISSFLPASS